MAKLALYKGKGLIGNAAIRLWTNSPYSHCEWVVGEIGYSSSLMDGGVRGKKIDFKPEHWDFIDYGDEVDAKILAYYENTKKHKYSWWDLIRSQIFNTAGNQDGAAFCSDWCAAAIGIPNSTLYSPKTLGPLLEYLKSLK